MSYFLYFLLLIHLASYLLFAKWRLNKTNNDVFDAGIAFGFGYLMLYCVRSFDLSVGGSISFAGDFSGEEGVYTLVWVEVLALSGWLMFIMGYRGRSKSIVKKLPSNLINLESGVVGRSVILLCLVTISLALATATYFQFASGYWFFDYWNNLNTIRLGILNDVAYLKFIIDITVIGFLFAMIAFYRIKHPYLLFAVGFLAFSLNFIFAHRVVSMMVVIWILMFRHYFNRRLKAGRVLLFVFIIVLMNGIFATYRDFRFVYPDAEFSFAKAAELSGSGSVILELVRQTYGTGIHGVDSLVSIQRAIDAGSLSHHYGLLWIRNFIGMSIPYSVWPQKPLPSYVMMNNVFQGQPIDYFDPSVPMGGVVETVLGDLYWAGGVIGILLGMYCLGVFYRYLYDKFVYFAESRLSVTAYLLLLPFIANSAFTLSVPIVKGCSFFIIFLLLRRLLSKKKHVGRGSVSNRNQVKSFVPSSLV